MPLKGRYTPADHPRDELEGEGIPKSIILALLGLNGVDGDDGEFGSVEKDGWR